MPDVSKRIDDLGLQDPVGSTRRSSLRRIDARSDGPLYAKLIKDLNIKLD